MGGTWKRRSIVFWLQGFVVSDNNDDGRRRPSRGEADRGRTTRGTGRDVSRSGGMSTDGTTTKVGINRQLLDTEDNAVICKAICTCDKSPARSKLGAMLKQTCVSKQLGMLDEAQGYQSTIKPEVSYDMTKYPPEPMMSERIPTKPHAVYPGWIQDWWKKDQTHPPFKKGNGMVRRPDVIIVKDGTQPPTQDNIKDVVEIKFPPDKISEPQLTDYQEIAGPDKDVVVLTPEKCLCGYPVREPEPAISPEDVAAAGGAAGEILRRLIGRGSGGGGRIQPSW